MTTKTNEPQILFKVGDEYLPWVKPRNKHELRKYCKQFFGLSIAAEQICVDEKTGKHKHAAPLDAMWAAYSEKYPVVVWKASRGLGGKSTMMGALCVLNMMDNLDVTVLGGSAKQSKRVHEVELAAWDHEVELGGQRFFAPFKCYLHSEPTLYTTKGQRGNTLVAIAASSKSARGPHPQRLMIDEVDEVDLTVFDAAMGQPMAGRGAKATVLLSSTHQYPDGTMTEVLSRAKEKNWPVFSWCYRENMSSTGWLTEEEMLRTKSIINSQMWEVEYELGEPSIAGRLFRADTINHTFVEKLGAIDDQVGMYYEFEPYQDDGAYVTAVDWAQDWDFTVILTFRYDAEPYRLVAYERLQKDKWPLMVGRFEERRRRFPGLAIHDGWGIGKVIKDYFTIPGCIDYEAIGSGRTILYGQYVMAIELGKFVMPQILNLQNEHKYVRHQDLYLGGHPPDTVAASALANMAIFDPKNQSSRPKSKKPGKMVRARHW